MTSKKMRPPQFETGVQEADERISAFLEIVHASFPNRLRTAYLTGSWSDGSAVSRSDLDIALVFHGNLSSADAELFGSIVQDINIGDKIEIGALRMDAANLEKPIPAYLKSAKLLLGEDVFAELDLLSVEAVSRRWSLGALRLMQLLRGSSDPLSFPVQVPNPSSPTRGFFLDTSNPSPSTKLVVSTAARIAGARLAEEVKVQAKSKRHCLMEFNRLIGGEFSDYISDCTHILKGKWEYGVPVNDKNLTQLGSILDAHVRFENDFLKRLNTQIAIAERSGTQPVWTEACLSRVSFTGLQSTP